VSADFAVGQRVRIVRVDEIPYGLKYSYLASTIDKTAVVVEFDAASSRYLVRLDDDGEMLTLSANTLEAV